MRDLEDEPRLSRLGKADDGGPDARINGGGHEVAEKGSSQTATLKGQRMERQRRPATHGRR